MDMTKEVLVEACKLHGGYTQPHLNDQLFLQCKGFHKIANLEPYVNLKVLWLDQNGIVDVQGLDALEHLVSLFLHNNTIRRLTPTSFHGLRNLRILNLSHNFLTRVDGLDACPLLETLQLAHNRIESLEACEGVLGLEHLSSLDLSFNSIEFFTAAEADAAQGREPVEGDTERMYRDSDGGEVLIENSTRATRSAAAAAGSGRVQVVEDDADATTTGEQADATVEEQTPEQRQQREAVAEAARLKEQPLVKFFARMPELSVLYLHGNAIVTGRCTRQYRRAMIIGMPQLTYLDERPIFAEERKPLEAWASGGRPAEEAARNAIRQAKMDHLTSCVRVMAELKESKREERLQREREWERQQDARRAWLASKQVDFQRERTEVDHEEFEMRAALESEEEAAWMDITDAAKPSLHAALKATEDRAIRDEARREAEAEVAALERAMERERGAMRDAAQERQHWIEVFTREDEEADVAAMEEINRLLAELNPGTALTTFEPTFSDPTPASAEGAAAAAADNNNSTVPTSVKRAASAEMDETTVHHAEAAAKKDPAMWAQFSEWSKMQRAAS